MLTSRYAYVGSRTTKERNARGEGLSVFRIDPETSSWTRLQVLDDLVNPSFLAFDASQRFLYCVHGDRSEISAFAIDATGRLTFLNQQSTGGKNPVHLCIDRDNRHVVVANHVTSSLAVLPINPDGSLGALIDLVAVAGPIGPHRKEQPFPKPHQVLFDRSHRFIAVPDKGCDRVFVYELSPQGALRLVEGATAIARETSGPRHIVFHPSNAWAYVINELDSTITACCFDATTGRLTPIQVLPSIPQDCVGMSRASEIVISASGRFVYASNRHFDSIGVFSVEPSTGWLAPVGWSSSEGLTPRFIALTPDGRELIVANEDSDDIMRFAVDPETGALRHIGVAARIGSPVCIVFKDVA